MFLNIMILIPGNLSNSIFYLTVTILFFNLRKYETNYNILFSVSTNGAIGIQSSTVRGERGQQRKSCLW